MSKENTPAAPLRPDNMRRLNDPDGSAYIKGLCGDTMEMYLIIKDRVVSEAFFYTDGCSSSIACGATAARLAKNKQLSDVLRISPAEVLDRLGSVPDEEVHCAILSVMTLYKAVADYLLKP